MKNTMSYGLLVASLVMATSCNADSQQAATESGQVEQAVIVSEDNRAGGQSEEIIVISEGEGAALELSAETVEGMKADCSLYAKEDGIAEDGMEGYIASCVQSLKDEYQAVETENMEAPAQDAATDSEAGSSTEK